MAGDWIKMRTSLLTNPKVNGIARALESDAGVANVLSTGYMGVMSEIVTRNVMRDVTVSRLLVIWGAANEHARDGVFRNADLSDIDDMAGIPGFAAAMESVGWLEYDQEVGSVILPNFNEYNTSGDSRSAGAKTGAQRQKDYRARQAALRAADNDAGSDVTRDVTNDVTRNRREEKRREEEKQEAKASSSSAAPSDQTSELAQRLAKVTDEAIGAFNASALTKRNGGPLPNVSATVGREKRQQQVRRCLRTARAICLESTGDPRVTPEFWAAYFDLVAGDDFYSGRQPGGAGHENYVPDFELLTREATMVKLYDRQVAA